MQEKSKKNKMKISCTLAYIKKKLYLCSEFCARVYSACKIERKKQRNYEGIIDCVGAYWGGGFAAECGRDSEEGS